MTAKDGQGVMTSRTMSLKKATGLPTHGPLPPAHALAPHAFPAAQGASTARPGADGPGFRPPPGPPEAPEGPSAPVVRHLGSLIGWARLHSFDLIQARAGVDVDRSGILILAALHRLGPLRLSDLAADVGLDRSTISRQVAAVVRSGYVQKTSDPADARASLLTLTPRGQGARRRLACAWQEIVVELLADWPPDEQAQFGRLLGRLTSQVRPDGG